MVVGDDVALGVDHDSRALGHLVIRTGLDGHHRTLDGIGHRGESGLVGLGAVIGGQGDLRRGECLDHLGRLAPDDAAD
ncbi:Uncharacterised protein [Mycobacteroides abscessus subsp. massiliense]|nr:Uncharacterised protein [Mycobacteroides abscessus subsp. massiliense]